MKVRLLPSTRRDLDWFKTYYETGFPEGATRAKAGYFAARQLLRDHPFAGKTSAHREVRILLIPKTPFAFAYRVRKEEIAIIRVFDTRTLEFAAFSAED